MIDASPEAIAARVRHYREQALAGLVGRTVTRDGRPWTVKRAWLCECGSCEYMVELVGQDGTTRTGRYLERAWD